MIGLLSEPEIIELTGKKKRDAQIKQLRSMRVIFLVRDDGTLAIARAHVENVLGVSSKAEKEPELILRKHRV